LWWIVGYFLTNQQDSLSNYFEVIFSHSRAGLRGPAGISWFYSHPRESGDLVTNPPLQYPDTSDRRLRGTDLNIVK
jgi:hypothetical protein